MLRFRAAKHTLVRWLTLRCGLIFFGIKNIKKKLDPGALGLSVK
jgi:hypothetical protein